MRVAITAVLVPVFLWAGARTADSQGADAQSQTRSSLAKKCPAQSKVDEALAEVSRSMEQAKYQDVVALLEGSQELSCDARLSLLLSGAYEGSGNLIKAQETLERAHAVWPANTSIGVSLAREYLDGGQTAKAVSALEKVHLTPRSPYQELQEGVVVYIAGSKLLPAASIAEEAYKFYPSLQSLLLLANVLQLQGRYKDVNALLAAKRDSYKGSSAFLITAAESEFDAMLYDGAKQDLEQAIALDQSSYQAHFLLGNVLLASGDSDRATAEYRAAITLAPNQPRSYYQLALVAKKRQDEKTEQDWLAQALAADYRYAPAHCELGRILLSKNQYSDAVQQLNLAIEDNPQTEQAYYLIARAYAGLGEKDKSDEMVKRFVQVRAENRRTSHDAHLGQRGSTDAPDQ